MSLIKFSCNGNEKQLLAWKAWSNDEITDITYGGAKATGKSYLGCSLIFADAFMYPDTYYFIARKSLNDLRKWTMPSIGEVMAEWGMREKIEYTFNGQDNYYLLHNKSRVYLIDLSFAPSDPEYARFGSRQFTRGWIEEASECAEAAVQNISIAVGRWNNKKYNLKGKTLKTCNPHKGYLHREYFTKWRKGTLEPYKCFIQALPTDNKMLADGYLENLERVLSFSQKQRLLHGNWDYDDDPTCLCDWNAISDVFTNEIKLSGYDDKRLSADLAMKGRDRFIAGLMQGNETSGVIIEIVLDKIKCTGKEIEDSLKGQASHHHVGHSNIIFDNGGLGNYLDSYIAGAIGFNFNMSANDPLFAKMKDEMGYKLAELINNRLLKIVCTPAQRERLEQELSALKVDNMDADTQKKKIIDKEQMKEILGHSPDDLDMLLMCMYFLIIQFSRGYVGR